jgi:uncharacterized protein
VNTPPPRLTCSDAKSDHFEHLEHLARLAGPHLPVLAALGLAELTTVFVDARLGLSLHLIVLFSLLVHAALARDRPVHRFRVSLTLAPLIRVVSLAMPLDRYPLIYWYVVIGVPLFAAVIVAKRALGVRLRPKNVFGPRLAGQLAFALSGPAFGYVAYGVLQPAPLLVDYSWSQFLTAAAILLIFTGLLDELIFRGLLQRTAIEQFGRRRGIAYAALLSALLHTGHLSFGNVVLVLVAGLVFGWFAARTDSVLGVSLAHGLANITMLLIVPYWLATYGSLPFISPVESSPIGLVAPVPGAAPGLAPDGPFLDEQPPALVDRNRDSGNDFGQEEQQAAPLEWPAPLRYALLAISSGPQPP